MLENAFLFAGKKQKHTEKSNILVNHDPDSSFAACKLSEPLSSKNIKELANCTEIHGRLEVLGVQFSDTP